MIIYFDDSRDTEVVPMSKTYFIPSTAKVGHNDYFPSLWERFFFFKISR